MVKKGGADHDGGAFRQGIETAFVRIQLDALKRGDGDAWHEVYDACVDPVYRYAFHRLRGDAGAAEDVTQEVFLRAIESINTFRGKKDSKDMTRWLIGIGKRVMARRARRLIPVAARTLSLNAGHDGNRPRGEFDVEDTRPQSDQIMVSEDERRMTGATLATLPEHWEKALRWKYCDGLRVDEIAIRLGTGLKAAESILSRARAGFRSVYNSLVNEARLETED